jgi:hypothetical protein
LLELIINTGSLPAKAKHISGRCIKPASNLDRARHWLNDCLRNHNHGPNRAAVRPSRLVAVGTADGSEPIKIVEDPGPDEEYLAVSYRWGGAGTMLTTAKTFELFHTSIPPDQLPQTFQDAINIARDFGVGHIWIDSLCIVQDDSNDWETESAKMADIYNGALMTIMAASASDSQGGFFRDRPALEEMVALPYTDASGATELSVFVSQALPGYEIVVAHGPLFQRGWVFQERLMSKRKLIFGEDQTYWECNSAVLSESKIRNRNKFAYMNKQDNNAFRIFSDPSYNMNGPGLQKSPERLWAHLVQEYSKCSLTYETDRLPSLSGLARTFGEQLGGSYIAGLWQDQMPYSLSWFVWSAPEGTSKRNYYAPSWSWASTMGQVIFRGNNGSNELEVISIDIKLAGQDPYGRVCPGSSMCVRGRLRSGTLIREEGRARMAYMKTEQGYLGRGFLDRDDEHLPLNVVFLELSSGKGILEARCLILHETTSEKQFRRVGFADFNIDQDEDSVFYSLQKQVITLV